MEVSRERSPAPDSSGAGARTPFRPAGASAPTTCAWTATIPRKKPGRHPAGHRSRWRTKYGLRCCNVFHAGDGNLHPLILFDANDPDQLHRCELFGADILETSVALGGTVTGEHGVGIEKLSAACACSSAPKSVTQMFGAEAARSTPPGTLNPGKVIPTLHRCAEYGRMHVKKGLLALPRAGAVLTMSEICRAGPLDRSGADRACGRQDGAGHPRRQHQGLLRRRRRRASRSTCSPLAGISSYEPSELVVTVRTGTPLERPGSRAGRTRPVPALRAAALRPGRHGGRHGGRRPGRPGTRRPWAACATTCWAPPCSTAAPRC